MRFMAIGVHGPVDPAEGRAIAPRSAAWLREALAAGTIDCAYSMAGGGRMVIAEAESAEALLAVLQAAPDAEREWTLTALTDAVETIERYLADTAG
jgi:hypothetical protein